MGWLPTFLWEPNGASFQVIVTLKNRFEIIKIITPRMRKRYLTVMDYQKIRPPRFSVSNSWLPPSKKETLLFLINAAAGLLLLPSSGRLMKPTHALFNRRSFRKQISACSRTTTNQLADHKEGERKKDQKKGRGLIELWNQ